MKAKIFLVVLFVFVLASFVSAVAYSENQEVTLVEGEEVYVQIGGVNYKVFLEVI